MSFNCQVKSIKKLPSKDGELWRGWHKNGKLDYVGNKKNNQRDGEWSFFHPNGQKESEGEYVMGEKQGCWIEWYENGQIYSQREFENGQKNGLIKFW